MPNQEAISDPTCNYVQEPLIASPVEATATITMPEVTTRLHSPTRYIDKVIQNSDLFSYAIGRGLPREDLVSAGLISAWRADRTLNERIATGQPRASAAEAAYVKAAIRMGMKNAVQAERRHQRRLRALAAEQLVLRGSGQDPTAEAAVGKVAVDTALLEARTLLTDSQQEVLAGMLRGQSTQEIASETGRTAGTVSDKLAAVVKALREPLGVKTSLPIGPVASRHHVSARSNYYGARHKSRTRTEPVAS